MTATADLLARLRRHYIKPGQPLPGGVFLPEVTLGVAGGQRCDAIYVGFTSASGRRLVGHELKVSRADWRRELDQAGKADAWADQCHAWWIVAPSTDIVPPAELPDGWGLMTPSIRSKTRMRIEVAAHVHTDRQPSWEAVRSVMQRADTLRADNINQATIDARAKAQAEIDERVKTGVEIELAGGNRTARELQQLREAWAALSEALGIPVILDGDYRFGDHVTVTQLRAAVGFIRAHRDATKAAEQLDQRLTYVAAELQRAAKQLADIHAVAALEGDR